MRAPDFWRVRGHPLSILLLPLGQVWRLAGIVRETLVTPAEAPVPVVCIGNLVAGGAGKTPVALAVGARLRDGGARVHFLSRGYGGRVGGPVRVDPRTHTAEDVGDEALLLAQVAPTWVARRRRASARAAVAAGAGVLVMDDGFQNPSLHKDLSIVVVDADYGFGNRRLIPAGPLREPVSAGLGRAQALVLLDGSENAATATGGGLPVLAARLAPDAAARTLAGRRVLAFAGIGRPEKFFRMLAAIGCEVVETRSFPDHHRYRPDEIAAMVERAKSLDALPVTTAKDRVRLAPDMRPLVTPVSVIVEWREPERLDRLLAPVLRRAGKAGPSD